MRSSVAISSSDKASIGGKRRPVLRKIFIARARDARRLPLSIWLAQGTLMPAAELRAVGLENSSMWRSLHTTNHLASPLVCSWLNDKRTLAVQCPVMSKREARWANSIAYWRGRKGWSQEELGAALPNGTASKGTISGIENGKSKPSMERLYDIAEALGVTMAALLSQPPEAEVIDIWSRIPVSRQELAKDILAKFAASG